MLGGRADAAQVEGSQADTNGAVNTALKEDGKNDPAPAKKSDPPAADIAVNCVP
jgi:hypothetical protein